MIENLCKQFRKFLLQKYTGLTPLNYFARFKWVINAAFSDGYFLRKPTEQVTAKSNPSKKLKEHLEVEEYLALLNTPCFNEEIRAAFLFSCYTGLRWVNVKKLSWIDLKNNILTTRIIQAKTGLPVTLTLHQNDGPHQPTLYGVQSLEDGTQIIRPLQHLVVHPDADIAIGMLGMQGITMVYPILRTGSCVN